MFSCLWQLWDWLDPTSMENKKGAFQQNNPPSSVIQGNEPPFDSIPKHQHNTAPQHLRLLQYGLKISNSHQHQLNNPILHQHVHQSPYQHAIRLHLSPSTSQYNTPNIHSNPMHNHYNNQAYQLYSKSTQNQPIYQSNNAHANYPHPPPINQQNAQIWVPHQHPLHYHQQQLQQQQQQKLASQTPMQQTPPVIHNKPIKEVIERRKNSTNQQLRSPSAKRPLDAPVTLQGWLHKQGSEGLMLWKKRWFVLSEYCLFYYKGPEEEKLLGSILLPSYKVSICHPDDKVNKKYAFKCEHTNMRTYILAADSQELMMQWIRVLNLACLLQTNIESEAPSSYNQSNDNSDSGFNQQFVNSRNTPIHTHSSSNTTDLSNPSQEVSQYNQPLYANAPPKPRRLNDAGYSSPSPDILDRYANEPKYVTLQPPQFIQRNVAKSPSIMYANEYNNLNRHEYPINQNLVQNTERRTPDTYGRSKTSQNKGRYNSDYEDIYSEQYMYKRPLSPLVYNNKTTIPVVAPMQRTYTPVSMLGPKDLQYMPPLRKSPSNIPRPHSADFLEYEANHQHEKFAAHNRQPRPKSSLDINRNCSNDNYFYSEENYAEKMRKSAQYLSKLPKYQVKRPENDNTFPLTRSNTQPMHYQQFECPPKEEYHHQPTRSRSVLSEGSLSKELDLELQARERYRESMNPSRDHLYNSNEDDQLKEYDCFTRSASARLASIEQRLHNDRRTSMNKEGERKREESMKRLLEWKQRMLQSPLNRKMNQNINRTYPGKQDLYYRRPDVDYTHKIPDPYIEDGRHGNHPFPQYNSYSSDDEENLDRSKQTMQAGRTLETIPTETAPFTSISVLPSQTDTPNKSEEQINTTSKENPDDAFTKPLKLFNKEEPHLAHVSNLRPDNSEKFEETLAEIKNSGSLVKTNLAEFEESNLTENPSTPIPSIDNIIEENYMTMTPKKTLHEPQTTEETAIEEDPYVEMTQGINSSLLDPKNSKNPYEIICFSKNQMEPLYMELHHHPKNYKILDEKSTFKTGLPDILMSPQSQTNKNTISDSSDADDEASKDLESLDAPSHPRFSLSDTFRPASYYLGATQNTPEFHDSSDSELVSPPPIPRSPPPLEDLETDRKSSEHKSYKYRNSDQFFNSTNKYNTNLFDSGKKSSYLSLNSFKDTTDTFSIGSGNTDLENRSRLSHNSGSDIELRTHLSKTNEYERMLKRRPVSEEFCDEVMSFDSDFNKSSDCTEVDKYYKELHNSDPKFSSFENKHHDYENMCIMGQDELHNSSIFSNISTLSPISMSSHRRDNSRDTTVSHTTINTFQSDSSDRRSVMSSDFIQRCRPDSRASISAEISGFLPNCSRSPSNVRICSSLSICEIPNMYFSDINKRDGDNNHSLNQPAPYYYSDLSMNTSNTDNSSILTLNNQREALNDKRDIMHIVNPIRCSGRLRNTQSSHQNGDNSFKLATEARSVSVDFLNLADKSGQIDKKNIYESDTLKRLKVADLGSTLQSNPDMRNIYPSKSNEKFNVNSFEFNIRRSHSLEGLLENVLNENEMNLQENNQNVQKDLNSEGSYLWEEDSIWRERLRSASQRHTKSLDDLDCIAEPVKKSSKKPSRGITRGVTYVNDNIYNMPIQDKQQKYLSKGEGNKEAKDSFTIDREKLRQWDLMSSAPSDSQNSLQVGSTSARVNTRVNTEIDSDGDRITTADPATRDPASGSISLNPRDTFPVHMNTAKKIWTSPSPSEAVQSKSISNLSRSHDSEYSISSRQGYYLSHAPSHQDIIAENNRKVNSEQKLSVSAGDLLGRTHEELVLLLIQLRRQSTNICHAIEACYNEIDTIQAQLHLMDKAKRLENLQKLEQIKQHLLDLEKQYEKGKPLVNLVDNMVKLGSLYRTPSDRNNYNPNIRDRIDFNQQMQERRLLAEEKKDWNRINSSHMQLQEKVQQLYDLDRLIQEESSTLQGLQQDKEEIERALGGLRHKLTQGYNDPAIVEQARKQQMILENELSRVHLMLAQNSKKLEETVAGNARLEQELLVLKQKLQISRQNRSSPQCSNAGDSLPCVISTNAMLESDFQRVQQKVGDLQKQRQEIGMQVRQLTDRSNNLQQQVKPSSLSTSPSNQALGIKKRMHSLWRETDLDTMNIKDHGDSWENSNTFPPSTSPLYINTDLKQGSDNEIYNRSQQSDSTSDDTNQNLTAPEKQEIKTVRIVKRESERRQRDREKTSSTGKWEPVLEEDDTIQNSSLTFRPTVQIAQCSTNVGDTNSLQEQETGFSPNLPQNQFQPTSKQSKSPALSPVFKSEAARQIITEMSTSGQEIIKHQPNRRAVPKEKRRHYTAPHNNLIMKSFNELPTDDSAFDKIENNRRARDDLDMERALRQRIDAPDVVRSTLSSKELKYNESTIDNLLGTPNKINIPERYIPEQLPQLSVEEQEYRLRKVESIKKMLSDTTILSTSTANLAADEKENEESGAAFIPNKATSKIIEEKKQREHLLQLNQILAKQVMEMSKIVAVKALAKLPLQPQQVNSDDEDLSPVTPLPLYQQRDNFYS